MENITGLKLILLIFAGIIIGVLFTLGFTQPWKTKVLFTPQKASVNLRPDTQEKLKTPIPELKNVTILTPKKFVSKSYNDALNQFINSAQKVQNVNAELVSILQIINLKSADGNFSGFFDLIVQAKTSFKDLQGALVSFRSELDRLRLANDIITDTEIQKTTKAFLDEAEKLYENFQVYMRVLNMLLNGEPPNAKTLQDLTNAIDVLQKSAGRFSASLKTLLTQVGATLLKNPTQ